jgi:hypothetical protein
VLLLYKVQAMLLLWCVQEEERACVRVRARECEEETRNGKSDVQLFSRLSSQTQRVGHVSRPPNSRAKQQKVRA